MLFTRPSGVFDIFSNNTLGAAPGEYISHTPSFQVNYPHVNDVVKSRGDFVAKKHTHHCAGKFDRSDEGLTLETLALLKFYGGNVTLINLIVCYQI